MKEVPKKDFPDVSGGQYQDGPCIPPFDLPPGDYPHNPVGPNDVPLLDPGQGQN